MDNFLKTQLYDICECLATDSADCVAFTIQSFDQGYSAEEPIKVVSYTGEDNTIYDPELLVKIAKVICDHYEGL